MSVSWPEINHIRIEPISENRWFWIIYLYPTKPLFRDSGRRIAGISNNLNDIANEIQTELTKKG